MFKPRSMYSIAASAATIVVAVILLVFSSIYINQTIYLRDYYIQIYGLSIFSLVISILAIILAAGLIFVIYRQFPALTTLVSSIILFLTVAGLVCFILLLVVRNNVGVKTYKITIELFSNYSDSISATSSKYTVARVQQSFKCCGVEKATYWENTYPNKTSTPDSCCKKITPGCGEGSLITQDNIYLRGCAEPIANQLKKRYDTLIFLNFFLLVLILVSAVLAVIFERYMEQQYQTM